MKILIKSTNIKLDDNLHKYVEEKIIALEKYFKGVDSDLVEARIEIGKTTEHHKKGNFFRAEVNLKLPGKLLRAESEREDLFMAITEVKDDLQRQIKEYKTKPATEYKKGARKIKGK